MNMDRRDFLKATAASAAAAAIGVDLLPGSAAWAQSAMTWHKSVKGKNLRRDTRVSICVDEEVPPYAFVIVEGTAVISEDAVERAYWARKIGARYMGEDQADAYGKRNSVEGELVIRVTPTKIIAQKNVAGW